MSWALIFPSTWRSLPLAAKLVLDYVNLLCFPTYKHARDEIKNAHHALNSPHDHHSSQHCYCRIKELSVKARSNICLELSGCFKNKSASLQQRSLKSNPVDLPPKLHFMTQWGKRRYHSNHCTPDSYSTCSHFLFKGNAAWSHYEPLNHKTSYKKGSNKKWECSYFQQSVRNIYFVHMMYVSEPLSPPVSHQHTATQQLFTSGPMGGF